MKKILTVSLGTLLIATAANADIASVDYVTNGLAGKQDASTIGTVNSDNMGTTASTVVAAIKEVADEAAAAQTTANTAKTNAATAQSTADTAIANAATAQSTADTAKANAATAQTTADTAKANAATAQTTANSALTKANAAVVANNAIQAGTGTKITYDSKGLVTGSASLTASDIPTLSIGKVDGLQTALDGKQATLTTSNIKGSNGVSVGISNGVITVTGTTYSTGTDTKSGLTKLYTAIGSNTDGTMTQSAIKTALGTKQEALGYTPENVANKVPTETGLTASSTDTQYPSAKLVYTALNGKQDKLVDGENIDASNGVAIEQGQDGKLTIKGTGASSAAPGVLKLHNDVAGDDVDGTVTQSAIKTALATKQATLTTSNIKGSNGVSVGISNGVITVTGTTYSTGSDTKSGLTKLYTGTGSNTDGTMTQSAITTALNGKQDKLTIDSELSKTSTNPLQNKVVTEELDRKQNASTAVEVTTAGTAVGSATVPVYVNASGVVAPITSYAGNAATATKATEDASGRTITTTYATKTELTTGLADKQVAAPVGVSEDNFYVTNNDGAWVDMFTAMPRDPECAEEKCALTYKAGKYAWEVVRE